MLQLTGIFCHCFYRKKAPDSSTVNSIHTRSWCLKQYNCCCRLDRVDLPLQVECSRDFGIKSFSWHRFSHFSPLRYLLLLKHAQGRKLHPLQSLYWVEYSLAHLCEVTAIFRRGKVFPFSCQIEVFSPGGLRFRGHTLCGSRSVKGKESAEVQSVRAKCLSCGCGGINGLININFGNSLP